MKIRYRRITVQVPGNRPKACIVCNHTHTKKGKPLTIQMHHTRYAYKTSEVRKNPLLALENTVPLCFPCHRVADACRLVNEYPKIAVKFLELPGIGGRREIIDPLIPFTPKTFSPKTSGRNA